MRYLLAPLLVLLSCQPQPITKKPAPPIIVRELTETLRDARTRGKPGDLLLSNGRISLVVERSLPEKRRSFLGQPIDLWSASSSLDRVEWLGLSLQIDTQTPKAVAYQKTEATERTIRSSASLDAGVEVITEYSMRPHEDILSIESTIKNTNADAIEVALCQTGYLGNHEPWAPGVGFVERPSKLSAPWVGYEASGSFYTIGVPSGSASLQTTAVVIDEATFHNGFLLCSEKRQLQPQRESSQQWLISLSSKDLADATAPILTKRGEKLVTLSGQSKQESGPQWVEIHSKQRPFLRASLQNSRFDLRLPPGEYEAFISSNHDATTEKTTFSLSKATTLDLPSLSSGLLQAQVTENGQKIPARIIIYPESSRQKITPLFHSVEYLNGSGSSLYSLDGSATVALSPGLYRILATRGLAYNLPEQWIEIKAGQSTGVNLALTREVDTSGALASDLHLHSTGSRDSNVTLEARVISLIAEGVEVAVSTEHENIVDYAPTVKALQAERWLTTIVGEEITTAEPNLGHFNVFPIVPLPDGTFPEPVFSFRTTPEAIFAQARDLNPGSEIVQINHPRMEPKLGYFSIMSLDPSTGKAAAGFSLNFDTIEVFNGLELPHLDKVEKNLQDWYSLLNLGAKKVATGSSDSHILALQEVGYPRTYVFMNGASGVDSSTNSGVEALTGEQSAASNGVSPFSDAHPSTLSHRFVKNLREGRALVTNGPFLYATINGAGPGESTKKSASMNVDVEIKAASWIDVSSVDVVVNGAIQTTQKVSLKGGAASLKIPLSIEKDSWVVVIARGEKPLRDVLLLENVLPFAFLNPIYVTLK